MSNNCVLTYAVGDQILSRTFPAGARLVPAYDSGMFGVYNSESESMDEDSFPTFVILISRFVSWEQA